MAKNGILTLNIAKKKFPRDNWFNLFSKKIRSNFIVINCDVITNVQIMDMFIYHLNNKADATIGSRF